MQIVTIHPAGGRESRMQIVCHLFNLADSNVIGQKFVQFVDQLLTINRFMAIEMSHHLPGMHTGISPASPCHRNVLAQQQCQRMLQLLLNRITVWLYLPPVVAAAIVAESHKISHFGCKVTKYFIFMPSSWHFIYNFAP